MPLSARDRRALIWGGAIIALLLAYFLFLSGEAAPPARIEPIEPVAAAPSPPPPPPAPAPPPPADVSQLRLYGVLGEGAVIGLADGSQHYVPLGREFLPGVRLIRVEVRHAVLASAGGEIRLGFDGVGQGPAAPVSPTAPAGEAEATTRYRLGLAPRTQGGRVTGFTVRPNADLPALTRAGIRPGDVILSVNGSRLDEERMLELAWTIANSERTEFQIERGGRRVRAVLQGS